ncbi:MAG: hypothetical protein LUE27_01895 [Clostridia bacterium]|nr:hypothetical protein [Clostridia bacterium]
MAKNNFNVTLDLGLLPEVKFQVSRTSGHNVLFMDLDASPAVSKWRNGTWHLALTAWERNTVADNGDTHFLKPRLGKETFDAMSDEERRNIPIVGNMAPVMQKGQQSAVGMQTVGAQQTQRPVQQQTAAVNLDSDEDDLPF